MAKQTSSHKKSSAITAKCNNCGEMVKSNQKFCPGCGAELDWGSLDEPEEKPAAKAAKESPAKTKSAATKAATQEEKLDYLIRDAKAKRNKWLIIGGVGFLVIFITAGATPDGEEPNGAIMSIGMIAIVLSVINIITFVSALSKYNKAKKK